MVTGKILISKVAISLLMLFCIVSCESTDDRTSESLPKLTTEGKNTFGCKIDGQIFLPKRKVTGSPYNNEILQARYVYDQYHFNGYALSIVASNQVLDKYISIKLQGGLNPLQEGNVYPISIVQGNNFNGFYEHSGATISNGNGNGFTPTYSFYTDDTNVGELEIIKLDTINQIISGQFWFNCKEANRDTISEITEGRFDLKYSKDF